ARLLLVACRSMAMSASSRLMPQPSSATWIAAQPPCLRFTRTARAPASIAISTSSLTTDAGNPTTSPAGIWLTTWSSRIRVGMRRPVPRARAGGESVAEAAALSEVQPQGRALEPERLAQAALEEAAVGRADAVGGVREEREGGRAHAALVRVVQPHRPVVALRRRVRAQRGLEEAVEHGRGDAL